MNPEHIIELALQTPIPPCPQCKGKKRFTLAPQDEAESVHATGVRWESGQCPTCGASRTAISIDCPACAGTGLDLRQVRDQALTLALLRLLRALPEPAPAPAPAGNGGQADEGSEP